MTGHEDRDKACNAVLAANKKWREEAHAFMSECFTAGDKVIGEDIRNALTNFGIIPNHHNAWGAFVLRLVRRGELIPTGEYRSVKGRQSHARRTPVYLTAVAAA